MGDFFVAVPTRWIYGMMVEESEQETEESMCHRRDEKRREGVIRRRK